METSDQQSDQLPRGLWPKVTIKAFNVNPRAWPDFELSFKAIVYDSCMPDFTKMIALRYNLDPEVKRRVTHLFGASSVYQETWVALHYRFGNQLVIIHAHI